LAEGKAIATAAYYVTIADGLFIQFTEELRTKEQAEKDARLAKLRPMLRNMLKGNPSVYPYTTFGTADKVFAQHPIWQQAKIEAERKLIFEEYVEELRQKEIVSSPFV
jgi:pre-mRNA-processing factor 40